MDMQVTTLSMGSGMPVLHGQEFPAEKRPVISGAGEQRAAFEHAEVPLSLPGSKPAVHDLQKTTLDLEQISLAFNRRLKFVIDQESREILIKVIDNETDKVIKVLPPEELQRLHSSIKETIGFLFDRMV